MLVTLPVLGPDGAESERSINPSYVMMVEPGADNDPETQRFTSIVKMESTKPFVVPLSFNEVRGRLNVRGS